MVKEINSKVKLSLIPNKLDMIANIVNGDKKPNYLSTSKMCSYLWRYFVNECAMDLTSDEVVENILTVMEQQGVKTSIDSIKTNINYFLSSHKDGQVCPPLKNYTDGINIYQSEVDAIKNADINLSSKKTMLGLLILRKLENLQYNNNDDRIWYYWSSVTKLCGSHPMRDSVLRELSESGLLEVPLYDDWMKLNCMSHEGEVAFNIKDNFYDIGYWYNECIVGKTGILAVDIKQGTKQVINDTYRDMAKKLSINGHKVNGANLQKCEQFKLLTTGGYYFVRVNGDLVDNEKFHDSITHAYNTANSRKRKMSNDGLSATEYVKLKHGELVCIYTTNWNKVFAKPVKITVGKLEMNPYAKYEDKPKLAIKLGVKLEIGTK